MSIEFEENDTKQTKVARKLGQGIKIFHDPKDADVDIIAVPGLGTNPEECWTCVTKEKGEPSSLKLPRFFDHSKTPKSERSERKFNWLRDSDGLASLCPKSRIMLYDYASAWKGQLKVRATMKSICQWLLDDLREKRRDPTQITRPLIFIGHSMGGVVVAKTLNLANAKREYEAIVTCTVGCLFFGAPFQGSDMARIALLYSSAFGNEAYEALLHFMRSENNDILQEVTNDFVELCGKLSPSIELYCFWEQIPTDVSYSERYLPSLMQHKAFKISAQALASMGLGALNAGTHFVNKESAILQGSHEVCMTATHVNLIKFDGAADPKFQPVQTALREMVASARVNARKRTFWSGQNLLTQKTVSQVRQTLEGVNMRLKLRSKIGQRQMSSWLTTEPLYQQWLLRDRGSSSGRPHLWLKGGAGLGKTNASLAAIQQISKSHLTGSSTNASAPSGNFLAFFLCESMPGCCTGEDILKSLITQLINQEESLAQHGARWFVPNARSRYLAEDISQSQEDEYIALGAKATATVDNLWECLHDMINDPAVNVAFLVVNNIHVLDSGGSTTAFLSKLREYAFQLSDNKPESEKAKWLVTSRSDKDLNRYLSAKSVASIDLDNGREYGAKLKDARRHHTREAVSHLSATKNYTPDLAFFVRSSIESQSVDETWIEVLCILLGAIPNSSSNLEIRKWLREVSPYKTHALIDHAWRKTLQQNDDSRLEMEELVQALTIAYEPPSLSDLVVLTQIGDQQDLTALVKKCYPVLEVSESDEHRGKVVFTNAVFQQRLSTTCHADVEQTKQYHGLMALRCFEHIKTSYKPEAQRGRFADVVAGLKRSTTVTARINEHEKTMEVAAENEDASRPSLTLLTSTIDCTYPINYLFRHLGEASPDVAQELCDEDPGFWGRDSPLRDAWLRDFQSLTSAFKDLNTRGMSALHVAAGIGAHELVEILVTRNSEESLSWANDDGMTALHIAAFNNQEKVTEMLIRRGSDIEAGEGAAGTPLRFAALRGNCSIMKELITRGANVNALSQKAGPVINAAILSGNVQAVKLIMEGDVRFDLDYTKCDAPLSLSARMSEPNLFQDILSTGREKWLQNGRLLDQALDEAASNKRLRSLQILLEFPHIWTYTTLERAVLSAAYGRNWTSVIELLNFANKGAAQGNSREVRLDDAFYLSATSREERTDVLQLIWSFVNGSIARKVIDFSLYQSTLLRKEATVRWLLETAGADPNTIATIPASLTSVSVNSALPTDFQIALNAAASSGSTALVQALLDHNAAIDGNTVYALQLAARQGHTEVCSHLLQRGADVNRQVPDSEDLGFMCSTALQAACENNWPAVVELLLKHGADPNLGGGRLTNPITAATQEAQPEILRQLLNAPGINVNVTGGDDKATPLINASKHMVVDSIELLLKSGADVNARSAAGDTPLILAAARGDKSCVELLCSHGADVTYRSPNRGLAMNVAASGLHPQCAQILADKMGETIEDYRENGFSELVIAKRNLESAHAQLKERDVDIRGLKALLSETEEQLEAATAETEIHKQEKQRIISNDALQSRTYESMSQQVKQMQMERAELTNQLDASKGQVALANDTVTRYEGLLKEEKKRNVALRESRGYAALQEEKQAALEMVQQEKQAAIDQAKVEEQIRATLREEMQGLQASMLKMREELDAAQTNAEQAVEIAEEERRQKKELQAEIQSLQSNTRELEETIASVQAAAAKSKELSTSRQRTPKLPEASSVDDYFRSHPVIAEADESTARGTDEAPVLPRRPVGSSPPLRSMTTSPLATSPGLYSSPTMSPRLMARSPGSQGEIFRTIHGIHRPDGSQGGYPTKRRTNSDSLYDVSIKNGVAGNGKRSSKSSLHSSSDGKNDVTEGWVTGEWPSSNGGQAGGNQPFANGRSQMYNRAQWG